MKFYRLSYYDEGEFRSEWRMSKRAAEHRARELRKEMDDGEPVEVNIFVEDVPTKRKALCLWLNEQVPT